jgi:uncharacterized RDD family membrane protein YckC
MAEPRAFGGFWIRFLAYLVDNVVLLTALFGLLFVGVFLGELWLKFMAMLCVVAPILYWGVMQASARQATFGKALLGLKVTDESGNRMSLLRSFARELAKLVSAIPLMLGFIIAAFTGRKQALHDMIASTTVVRESPGHVLVGLIIGVFGWLAPAGFAMFVGGALLAVMLGTMGTSIFPQATKDSRKHVAVQTAPAPKVAAAPLQSAPSGDVDTLLAARLDGMEEKPGMTRAGPAILHLDTFFGGSFWIKTYLPPLREFRGAKPTLSITRIWDSKGADLYDPKNQLETDFFQQVSLSPAASPVPHLTGTRSVNLRSGASTSDLQRVEGTLKLDLPVNAKLANFTAADAGKPQTLHGNAITLVSLGEKEAQLRVGGEWSQLVSVTGYGADDKPVPTGMGPGSGGAVKITFQRPATRLEVMIAESRVQREFPFLLTRTSSAGVPSTIAKQESAKSVVPATAPVVVAAPQPALKPKPAWSGPQPLAGQPQAFLGLWRNEDAQTDTITRMQITKEKSELGLHMWGKCDTGECKWAYQTRPWKEAETGVTVMIWGTNSAMHANQVLLTPEKKLRIDGTIRAGDKPGSPERNFVVTLVRAEPASASAAASKPIVAAAPKQAEAVTPKSVAPHPAAAPVAISGRQAAPGPKYNDLMTAVMVADPAAVQELLAFGKWPDKPDSNGLTPLMVATMRGDRDTAELLLKAGADPDQALRRARERRDAAMTSLLERYLATSTRP